MGDMQAMMKRLFSMSDETVLGDLEGAADFLRSREDATGKVGCIGFCMGGRYTLLFACASDRLSAAVDCWGGFIDKATPEERSTPARPTPPLELADQLHCSLLAAIGAEDQNPSPEIGSAAARPCRRQRAGGQSRRLRGRRACLLRRLPTHVSSRSGWQAVGGDRAVPGAKSAHRVEPSARSGVLEETFAVHIVRCDNRTRAQARSRSWSANGGR